jgi:hypothetical protein
VCLVPSRSAQHVFEEHYTSERNLASDGSGLGRFWIVPDVIEHSLRDAIEATKAVNTVQWDVDSIRSIALTIFIQRARG